ncbi:MAG: hypothetical protein J0H91_02860 [Rhodospirillales bacterium]|nr:hypothetical protein [Rhodospirillales bacterium]
MTRWPRRQATAFVWLVVALVAGLIWVSAEATIRHQEDQARANALEGAMLRARAAAADLESTLEATAGLHILAQARATLLERGDLTGALAIQFQLQALALRPVFGISGMAVTDRQGVVTWTINGQKGNGQKGNNQGGGSEGCQQASQLHAPDVGPRCARPRARRPCCHRRVTPDCLRQGSMRRDAAAINRGALTTGIKIGKVPPSRNLNARPRGGPNPSPR